jgi:membrane carboxypeptidase/penicillin-binding protein
MSSTLPVLRARRERRLDKQKRSENRARGAILSGGIVLSILLGAAILLGAFAYADVTRGLPSTEILPRLLNPPDGLLLQPTRIYDRTGTQLLATFAPEDTPRRYIPVSDQNPQHIPETLVNAVIAAADPGFWKHSGYSIEALIPTCTPPSRKNSSAG